jgi:hypothetical protein
MTDEALKLIERLVNEADLCRNDGANDIAALLDEAAKTLAAPVQEPVAEIYRRQLELIAVGDSKAAAADAAACLIETGFWSETSISTAPPAAQRQWVGLTDDQKAYFAQEIVDLGTDFVAPIFAIVEAIEAKLKERNRG